MRTRRLHHRHLCPEALAPAGLCCPGHQRLSASSANLEISVSFPGSAGYRRGLWHSRIILPDSQTFRTFTAVLSSIAAFTTPEAPVRAPQFFRTGTGHRVIRRPLAAPITPQISFMREVFSTLNPFTLVTALLFARPTGLTRPAGLCVPAGPLGLLLPGFQVARVTPCSCRISLRGRVRGWRASFRVRWYNPVRGRRSRPEGNPVTFVPVLSPAPWPRFQAPAHQTGRADFPHPAFGRDHVFAHGRSRVVNPRRVRPWSCHSLRFEKRTYFPTLTLCFRQNHRRSRFVACRSIAE